MRSWKSTTRSVSAIAPADQAITTSGTASRDVEETQQPQQHADMTAGDDQRAGTAAGSPAPPRDAPAMTSRSAGWSRSANSASAARTRVGVAVVEQPNHRARIVECGLDGLGPVSVAPGEQLDRRTGGLELDQVEQPELLEVGPVLELGDANSGSRSWTSSHRPYRLRLTVRPPSRPSSSASSGSRSCQPAVTVAKRMSASSP